MIPDADVIGLATESISHMLRARKMILQGLSQLERKIIVD